MSYLQPLITSAFATYAVSRSAYVDRADVASGVERQDQDDNSVSSADAGKPRSESGDILDLSAESRKESDLRSVEAEEGATGTENVDAAEADTEAMESESVESDADPASKLTPEEQEQVEELKARDAEVRVHEQAHVAAGGAFVTGRPSYTYQTGPDGQKYAIGGEVGIDTGEISGDPEATIQKMQTVARAALAPAEPSSQDYKVAAAAKQKEAQARAELARQNGSGVNGSEETESSAVGSSDGTVQQPEETGPISSTRSEKSGIGDAASRFSDASASVKAANSSARNSAYQAQSTMPLSTIAPRFSAFA